MDFTVHIEKINIFIYSAVILLTGKRSLEWRLGDLRLARVRQAANPRTPVDFLAIHM